MSRLLFSPDYEQEIAWELERWCRLVIVTPEMRKSLRIQEFTRGHWTPPTHHNLHYNNAIETLGQPRAGLNYKEQGLLI